MKLIILLLLSINIYAHKPEKKALLAIKKYGQALKKELKKGLKKSPQEAVKTCHMKAPSILKDLHQPSVEIGRVSLKNRNPQNSPQKWQLPYIKNFHNKTIKKPYITVSLDSGKTGLLKPIKTMPLCLKCHGQNINPKLYKEIKRLYPEDKATGYKAGEIRGFFWAEY